MPRLISTDLRRRLEEPRSDEYLVVLLQIDHSTLSTPIRVANDVVAYVFGGETYLGFPFELELIDDSTQVPRGRIRIQNVDRVIGEAVLELTTPPFVTLTLVASSDFEDTLVDGKRYPLDDVEPVVEYQAANLIFGSISVDAATISAELSSFDMTREPWPAARATADRLPGLDP